MVSTTMQLASSVEEFPEKTSQVNESTVSAITSKSDISTADVTTAPTMSLIEISKVEHGSFGFNVVGGVDSPHIPGDNGIFVSGIDENGPAAGQLNPGDKIVKVNDVDISCVSHDDAVSVLRSAGERATFLIDNGAELRLVTPGLDDDRINETVTIETKEPTPVQNGSVKDKEDDNEDAESVMSTHSVLDDVPRTPRRPLSILDPINPSMVTELIFVTIGLAVLTTGVIYGYRLLRRS